MKTMFAVIGGDLRSVYLAKRLAEDGNMVYTYGLEKADQLQGKETLVICNRLKDAIERAQVVIGPTPFSKDEEEINAPFSQKSITITELIQMITKQLFIAGSIKPSVYERAQERSISIIDIMKKEELAIYNAIATAEGTIELAISHTERNLHGSKVLLIGFGRIGKVLAQKLTGLSAKVTCAARKEEDFAWIKAYGYEGTNTNQIGEDLSQYDIIINTVPHEILNQERMQYIKPECLIIDLASYPGGIDKEAAKQRNLKFIWALALPGKVAPIATAEFIKNTIYHTLEINELKVF